MAKARYEKSSAQLDMEERAKSSWQPSSVLNPGQDPQKSDNGFIGVSPEYQNYADEKFAPLPSEKGVEADLESAVLTDDADHKKAAPEEGEVPEDEYDDDEDEDTPPTPLTPPTGSSSS